MKQTGVLILMAVMMVSLVGPAMAAGVNDRQDNQKDRIQQGVKSGELTKKESAKLIHGQKKVNRIEKKAKADGTLTDREKARLLHAQNVQSRKIYRQKHDKQDRD